MNLDLKFGISQSAVVTGAFSDSMPVLSQLGAAIRSAQYPVDFVFVSKEGVRRMKQEGVSIELAASTLGVKKVKQTSRKGVDGFVLVSVLDIS